MALDHEKLEVYQIARELVREVHRLKLDAPKRRADLTDQLQRPSSSIGLNIAEGSGEFSPREKTRFYRIAKRSTTESSAVLDLLVDVEILTEIETATAHQLAERIVAMLIRLIQSLDGKQR